MDIPLNNLVPSELVAKLFQRCACSSVRIRKIKSGYAVNLNFSENFENSQEGDSVQENEVKYRRKSKFQSYRDSNRLMNYNNSKLKSISTSVTGKIDNNPSDPDDCNVTENETTPTVLSSHLPAEQDIEHVQSSVSSEIMTSQIDSISPGGDTNAAEGILSEQRSTHDVPLESSAPADVPQKQPKTYPTSLVSVEKPGPPYVSIKEKPDSAAECKLRSASESKQLSADDQELLLDKKKPPSGPPSLSSGQEKRSMLYWGPMPKDDNGLLSCPKHPNTSCLASCLC